MKWAAFMLIASIVAESAMAAAPKNPCEKPVLPNKQASDIVVKAFNKHFVTYKQCIDTFTLEQRKIANESKDPIVSQQAFDAAEAAVADFNVLVNAVNAQHANPDQ